MLVFKEKPTHAPLADILIPFDRERARVSRASVLWVIEST